MRVGSRAIPLRIAAGSLLVAAAFAVTASAPAGAQQALRNRAVKGQPIGDLLSAGGYARLYGKSVGSVPDGASPFVAIVAPDRPVTSSVNEFVNDPCLDPPPFAPFPFDFFDVVQSETEIGVLDNGLGGLDFKRMVAGYNDSRGFSSNTEGLSGYSYSTNSGKTWIDGGGLPVRFPDTGAAPPAPLSFDQLFGDPGVDVDNVRGWFYYASLYVSPEGWNTIAVNRGKFRSGGPQGRESVANIRCGLQPSLFGVALPPPAGQERIIWEKPVVAVAPPFLGEDNLDGLDKEWIYVNQETGAVYVTYTRFTASGETPIEVVVSYDQGQTWTPPRVIVPNLVDTFNQGTQPVVTPSGRLIVSWFSRKFSLTTGQVTDSEIQEAYSDNDGITFSSPITVAEVNQQGEPKGYNRGRRTITDMPTIAVDKGKDDGLITPAEQARPGFGNLYVVYFDGRTPDPSNIFDRVAQIHLSRSTDDGLTWGPEVKVSDDNTLTTHIFPVVQADAEGDVYVAWRDRRRDTGNNLLEDTWAAISEDRGQTFEPNVRQSDVPATSMFTRADAAPNFGDYNSSELLNFDEFVMTWSDGRFLPPGRDTDLRQHTKATPDMIFTRQQGLE